MSSNPSLTNLFVTVDTIHRAEIAWWWTDEKLHDTDYHIKVWESVDAKVVELVGKYEVTDDTEYRTQWEGRLLYGEDRERVVTAANELARYMAKFKGLKPLPSF